MEKSSKTVTAYIAAQPLAQQKLLKQLRSLIKKAAPRAEEKISYGMPYYHLNGRLVYFAGFRHHIGFYPMPSAVGKFKKELLRYKTSKSTIQFPLDKPLPQSLIKKIVAQRVKENSRI